MRLLLVSIKMSKLYLLLFVLQFAGSYAYSIQPRIINGHLSRTGQFPSFVFFHTDGSGGNKIMGCGGTLISDRYGISSPQQCKNIKWCVFISK